MSGSLVRWSTREKSYAKKVLDKAYKRLTNQLIEDVKAKVSEIKKPEDMWKLQEYLNIQRKRVEGLFEFRTTVMLDSFATLIKEGWIRLDQLSMLSEEKYRLLEKETRS